MDEPPQSVLLNGTDGEIWSLPDDFRKHKAELLDTVAQNKLRRAFLSSVGYHWGRPNPCDIEHSAVYRVIKSLRDDGCLRKYQTGAPS